MTDVASTTLPPSYLWQAEALTSWAGNGYRGVIEAVTGSGKSRIGHEAVTAAVAAGHHALVLVPTVVLLRQWDSALRPLLDRGDVGLIGGGSDADFGSHRVLIATVQSAHRRSLRPPLGRGLIVADECHRYGAPSFAEALSPEWGLRLGLTATYERNDSAVDDVLTPYFGRVVYALDYRRALDHGVVAPFNVALVRTQFTADERDRYDRAYARARELRRILIHEHGVPDDPFGDFMVAVQALADDAGLLGAKEAREYLKRFSEYRQTLAETEAKTRLLEHIAPGIGAADRALVFTETIDGAMQAAQRLAAGGSIAEPLHSHLATGLREDVMRRFRQGFLDAVATPHLLDEGVDVPEADVAVVAAASRTRRQMIQRMGRVVRRKRDNRPARFVLMYVAGTPEDPRQGGHEAYLDMVLPVAHDISHFDSHAIDRLNHWLADTQPVAAERIPRLAEAHAVDLWRHGLFAAPATTASASTQDGAAARLSTTMSLMDLAAPTAKATIMKVISGLVADAEIVFEDPASHRRVAVTRGSQLTITPRNTPDGPSQTLTLPRTALRDAANLTVRFLRTGNPSNQDGA